jgi:hypothetical protein
MLILIAVFLAVAVALVSALPFLRSARSREETGDESSPQADIERRWDAVVAGLRNTELEWAIGNLTDDDHRSIMQQYMLEAADLMKAMGLEEDQEEALLADLGREVREVRARLLGPDPPEASLTCPNCSAVVEPKGRRCSSCGRPLQALGPDSHLTEGEV